MTRPTAIRPAATRFLYAGDFLLDAHTPGLDGLPAELWPAWSEARFDAARRIFDAAVSYAADALLLSGRLLGEVYGGPEGPAGDGWNFRSAAFLADQFVRLHEAGVPCVWHGPADQSTDLWPHFLSHPRSLTFLRGNEGVDVRGLRVGTGRAADLRLDDDRLVVGDDEFLARPPQSLGRPGPHGAALIDVDADGHTAETLDCDSVRFHERTISATDGTRWEQLGQTMRSHLRQLQEEAGPAAFHCVRWEVRGHGAAWSRLHAPGPHADLLASLRSTATEGRTPAFAESLTPRPDETQLDRWRSEDGPATRFAAAVRKATGRDLTEPPAYRAAAAATTLAH